MFKRSFLTILAGSALLTMAACADKPYQKDFFKDAQYWQKARATEATYMKGPKVQQMLNRDISRCVVEIRELERLGAIRVAMPADAGEDGLIEDPDSSEGTLAAWETPEREGDLRAEHLDYHDFETCMKDKGWERVEYMPYDVARKSRATYAETILGESFRTKIRERQMQEEKQKDAYEDLND